MNAPFKRPRGRPRKNPLPAPEPPPVVTKRPRGRPRKIVLPLPEKAPEPEVLPKRRGRPPKNTVKVEPEVKKPKDYYVLSIDDILFWCETTERDLFKQAAADYSKLKKAKATPEIRWYKDRIEVVS